MAILPYTQPALNKLEVLYRDLGFKVRYEKGSFKTGACMLQSGKIVVVNKFLDLEGRITSLIDVLGDLHLEQVQVADLDEKQRELLLSIKQKSLEI